MQNKFHYICTDCGKQISSEKTEYLCSSCKIKNKPDLPPFGVLKTNYQYSKINSDFETLQSSNFIDILPINNIESLPNLKVGNTPLYNVSTLDNNLLDFELFLKDDSQNPTFSFKDRASAIVSAYAKENNINTIIAASTGNAGSSLAGICASQKQKAVIFVPALAPKAKLTQIVMYGATIVPINGNYDKAFDLSIELTNKYGFYNRNTAFNPLTIEGKKTVAFEIFSQLKNTVPDNIFIPVGDGVIISGVYKGFEDLLKIGIIKNLPKIISCQTEGSNNINNNILHNTFSYSPSKTIADSISVDIPRNFNMAKQYILKYSGDIVTLNDNEILSASIKLSRNTGIFSEPAAATAFAGLLKYYELKKINKNTKNVVLLTGSGLKDLNSVQNVIEIPKPLNPDLYSVEKFLNL